MSTSLLRSALLLACLTPFASAQDSSAAPQTPPAASQPAAGDSKADKSGTNPLNFQTEFRIFNDTQFLQGRGYANLTTFQYIHPFASNFNVRFRLPIAGNDRSGSNEYGLGDVTLRANWVPYINKKIGVLLGTEFSFNTASKGQLGSGKHTIAPVGVLVFFLKDGWLFAPAYQHTVSYAGDSTRSDISVGATDFYLVKLTKSKRNWFIFDPTLITDYHNDRTSGTFEFEAGQVVGRMMHGVGSLYIRPGFGIGPDRIYNWSLEAGFKIIGF